MIAASAVGAVMLSSGAHASGGRSLASVFLLPPVLSCFTSIDDHLGEGASANAFTGTQFVHQQQLPLLVRPHMSKNSSPALARFPTTSLCAPMQKL